jgi:hypothetical protein
LFLIGFTAAGRQLVATIVGIVAASARAGPTHLDQPRQQVIAQGATFLVFDQVAIGIIFELDIGIARLIIGNARKLYRIGIRIREASNIGFGVRGSTPVCTKL